MTIKDIAMIRLFNLMQTHDIILMGICVAFHDFHMHGCKVVRYCHHRIATNWLLLNPAEHANSDITSMKR